MGNAPRVLELTHEALGMGMEPQTLLFDALIPSLEEVGARFERGDFFVPEMLIAGRAMAGAMEVLRPLLAETGVETIGKFLMGTVKGDVHDIGKNLVNIMLEGAGFEVIDLGVQVAPEKFVAAIEEHQPDIVGFSAFLTTTMPMFKANINALEKAGLRDQVIIMVGGAPVTQEYADAVGADGYAADASACVKKAKDLLHQQARHGAGLMGAEPLHTVIRSASRRWSLGHDRPFVLIGERINPTGRRIFQEQLRAGDLSAIERDVKAQVEGGADVLDVQHGRAAHRRGRAARQGDHDDPGAHRPADLHRLLGRRGARGRPVGLPGPRAGQLDHRRGRPDGGDPPAGQEVRRRRDRAAQRRTTRSRWRPRSGSSWSQKIVDVATKEYGIALADIVIDPLAMPIGADTTTAVDDHGDDARHPRQCGPQHDLRRLQRLLRHARPARAQRDVPADGDDRRA